MSVKVGDTIRVIASAEELATIYIYTDFGIREAQTCRFIVRKLMEGRVYTKLLDGTHTSFNYILDRHVVLVNPPLPAKLIKALEVVNATL